MIVLGIPIPRILHLQERKPWEVPHIDTMELWKFGDHKHYTSLDLLAHVLNVPSSKTDMNGSDVARVYWEEKDLQRIIEYCEQDVKTLALVWERLSPWHSFGSGFAVCMPGFLYSFAKSSLCPGLCWCSSFSPCFHA